MDPERLKAIAAKYEAEGVLITIADAGFATGGTTPIVSVSNIVLADGWDDEVTVFDFSGQSGQSFDTLFEQAVTVVHRDLQERWKKANLIDTTTGAALLAYKFSLGHINDWTKMDDLLQRLAMVQSHRLAKISIEDAYVELEYTGRLETLQSALSQNNYTMTFDQTQGGWVVTKN
ncbi:MAG: hypothetical protein R3261_13660, partial [Alphaproteobacteria bacterium]|nr:hypothetical protein [Alphaproteobacteria bacterium]